MNLVERGRELAALEELVDEARRGHGGALLFSGGTGIGKTSLLDAAAGMGVAAGMTVARVTGLEGRTELAHAGSRQLLAAMDIDLPPGVRTIVEGDGSPSPPGSAMDADPSVAVALELARHVLRAASAHPALVLADDAHWLDEPTVRLLGVLARRAVEAPLAVVLAARMGEPSVQGGGVHAQLVRALAPATIEPRPLSVEAVGGLVRERLGDGDSRLSAESCHALAGGNPLLTLELLRELEERGADELLDGLAVHRGLERFSELIVGRIAALGAESIAVAEAVAVLGAADRLDDACDLAELEPDEAARALDALAAAGIISPQTATFVHPLVRAAVTDASGLLRRQRLNERAAVRMQAQGRPALAVAQHLLAAGRGRVPWAAEALLEAARVAMRDGAPETAARLLRRAIDEGPAAGIELDVLQEDLALALWQANRPEEGAAEMGRALAATRDPAVVGRRALQRTIMLMTPRGLPQALDELAGWSGRSAQSAEAVGPTLLGLRALIAPGDLPPDMTLAASPATASEHALHGVAAWQAWTRGSSAADVSRLAEVAVEGGRIDTRDLVFNVPAYLAIYLLLLAEHGSVGTWIPELLDGVRRYGSAFASAALLTFRARQLLDQGAFAEAGEAAADALRLAGLKATLSPMALAHRVEALVELERLEEAERRVAEAGDTSEMTTMVPVNVLVRAHGLVAEAREDLELARRCYEESGTADRAVGVDFNPASPWRADLARVLHALGDEDGARSHAAEHLELARRWGTPRAIATAAAASVAVGGALVSLPKGLDPHSPQAIRMRIAAAGRARPADQAAVRGELRQLAGALAGGSAPRLEAELRQALRALGARRIDDVAGLTAAQREVARLAVQGLSNREIAERLVLAPKSVENQLGRIYRRLGITGRQDLAAALGDER